MEVVLDRDVFLKGLQMVQNLVEARQTLPILANVLLETDAETLRVSATDLDVAARVAVPARIATSGSITLGGRKLTEIVKELPAASLALKLGDAGAVTLRCGGVTYRLPGLPADDFPSVVPAIAPEAWLALDARTLREMLAQTHFAISHDETRPSLNGIYFLFQESELRLVATDGHRLALSTCPLPPPVTARSGIVPRKAVLEIMRVLGGGEAVQVAITDNQFALQLPPTFSMTARLIEGQFPNYEAVLPRAQPRKVALSRNALTAALRRVSVVAEEKNKPVRFHLGPASLRLAAASQELGEAEEDLVVDYAGEEMTIGFNSRYVLDALAPIEKDSILLELKDATSPGVLRSVEEEGYRCVIMPMRI
jgi:DNA polymerase-3 subunit beta